MTNNATSLNWRDCAKEVEMKFLQLTNSAERAEAAVRFMDLWMTEELCRPQRDAVMAHMAADKYELLLDSFYQFIPFGTGGRRGRVGFGPNRINEVTVSLSVLGTATTCSRSSKRRGTCRLSWRLTCGSSKTCSARISSSATTLYWTCRRANWR